MSATSTPNLGRMSTGMVIVGLKDTKWVLAQIAQMPKQSNGYRAPIYLVERDIGVAQRAAVELNLRRDTRFNGRFGPDAPDALIEMLRDGPLERELPDRVAHLHAEDEQDALRIHDALKTLREARAAALADLRTELDRRAQERQASGAWADRYAQIRDGAPARVLLSTTRYSTYMRHACDDLAQEFEKLGHEARVLIEPDDHATTNPGLTLPVYRDFDPDLVVTVNFPRTLRDPLFPPGVPTVCWVQDAMSHFFTPLPEPPHALDFLAGHMYANSPVVGAYPPQRRLPFPMPVSHQRFHTTPVGDSERSRYACDIAYVSHQSEPASVLHKRSIQTWPGVYRGAIERIRERLDGLVEHWPDRIVDREIADLRRELRTQHHDDDDPQISEKLWHQYGQPMLERMLRHRVLEWASDIAHRHGLDFRIYGRGWEAHPTLARHARGELPYGDDLRACYQCARVHLHASPLGVAHQRQHQCAMSGGLMLSLRSWSEFMRENWMSVSDYLDSDAEPDAMLVEQRQPCYSLRNHPELDRLLRERERIPPPPTIGWDHLRFDAVYARLPDDPIWARPNLPLRQRPLRLLADPYAMTFSSREELEERVLRAVSDPQWRESCSRKTRERSIEHVSMRSFARSLLGLVSDTLCPTDEPQLIGTEA